jgi:hypothetical protein
MEENASAPPFSRSQYANEHGTLHVAINPSWSHGRILLTRWSFHTIRDRRAT